jgi:hypothetical protein
MSQYRSPALAALLDSQRAIEERMRNGEQSPAEVLDIGRQVLDFAAREDETLGAVLPLLDPAVRDELRAEHDQIDEDLQLLAWLLGNTPDSADVPALTASLARRMAMHLARDGRLLSRAARLTE